ncbi:Thiamine-monophosphate kinase [Rickettsiales bacterium Ac37b]|nr:Thiamine-monophosphate kinase [Rickettsiales bacterium Ac37b]
MHLFNEFQIINLIKSKFPSSNKNIVGIGDDAALIKISDTQMMAISKDLLVEDSHFRLSYFSPQAVAHKSLHSNLSDIAAMGIMPEYILLGMSIPPYISIEWIEEFINCLAILCKKHSIIVIGGDTVPSVDKLVISITVCGIGNTKNIKYINTAKPGDIICVAGRMGYAHLGLHALEKNIPGFETFKNAQLFPEAKLSEGIFLGNYYEVTAMTDLSDGLSIDLKNLCDASNVGAIVDINPSLTLDNNTQKISSILAISISDGVIHGGEDYGLLFTVKENLIEHLSQEFYQKFGYHFYRLGKITETPSIIYTPYN